jgi:hypothetical protein
MFFLLTAAAHAALVFQGVGTQEKCIRFLPYRKEASLKASFPEGKYGYRVEQGGYTLHKREFTKELADTLRLDLDKLYMVCFWAFDLKSEFYEFEFHVIYNFTNFQRNTDIPADVATDEVLVRIYRSLEEIITSSSFMRSHIQHQIDTERTIAAWEEVTGDKTIHATIFECLVIILSTVAQVFYIRKFLRDKCLI